MNTERLISKVNKLIQNGENVLSKTKTEDFISYVEYREMKGFSTSSLSFIEKLYGRNHTYYQNFNEVMKVTSIQIILEVELKYYNLLNPKLKMDGFTPLKN